MSKIEQAMLQWKGVSESKYISPYDLVGFVSGWQACRAELMKVVEEQRRWASSLKTPFDFSAALLELHKAIEEGLE